MALLCCYHRRDMRVPEPKAFILKFALCVAVFPHFFFHSLFSFGFAYIITHTRYTVFDVDYSCSFFGLLMLLVFFLVCGERIVLLCQQQFLVQCMNAYVLQVCVCVCVCASVPRYSFSNSEQWCSVGCHSISSFHIKLSPFLVHKMCVLCRLQFQILSHSFRSFIWLCIFGFIYFAPAIFFCWFFFRILLWETRASDHLLSICTRIYVYTRSLTRSIPFVCGAYSPATLSGQHQQWRQQQHHHSRNNRIKLYFVCSLPDILAFMASLSLSLTHISKIDQSPNSRLFVHCFAHFDWMLSIWFRRDGKIKCHKTDNEAIQSTQIVRLFQTLRAWIWLRTYLKLLHAISSAIVLCCVAAIMKKVEKKQTCIKTHHHQ